MIMGLLEIAPFLLIICLYTPDKYAFTGMIMMKKRILSL
jgi:hypothetical protein